MLRFRAPLERAVVSLVSKTDEEWSFIPISDHLRADLNDLGGPAYREPLSSSCQLDAKRLPGALYVLEGSSLGAQLLVKRAALLGLSAHHGARHLAQQTGDPKRWPAFVKTLERHGTEHPEEAVCAVHSMPSLPHLRHSVMTIRATEPPQVDLTTCDREPIHTGSIQPHGCLLACDISASFVLRHSANCADLLGIDGDINGRKLDALLGEEAVHTIRNALTRLDDGSRPVLLFNLENATGRTFDIAVHRYRSVAIIEFEPSLDETPAARSGPGNDRADIIHQCGGPPATGHVAPGTRSVQL
jgi:hypothetical protein